MREYELMFIVAQRDIKEGTHEAMIEQVRSLTEKNAGRVLRVRPWGLRQLAYPIQDFDYGYYVIMQILLEEEKSKDFEKKLKSVEQILRFIMLRKDERIDSDVEVLQDNVTAEELAAVSKPVKMTKEVIAAAAAAEAAKAVPVKKATKKKSEEA
jgi:small subunit ribosomal protein S6